MLNVSIVSENTKFANHLTLKKWKQIHPKDIVVQGSKGIRQWLINWCTSLKIIHKITPSEDCNLDTQLKSSKNQK